MKLLFTGNTCLINGNQYPGIPLILDSKNKILEVPSVWLRHLVLNNKPVLSSIKQYAYQLKYWWIFIGDNGIKWDEVSDQTLRSWRDFMLAQGVDRKTINNYIITVFRFYLWAEKEKYVRDLIGEADISRDFYPPITVSKKRGKKLSNVFTTSLLFKTVPKPILPTPTSEQITILDKVLCESYGDNVCLFVRDSCIISWMQNCGLRRAEATSLKVSEIPDWNKLIDLEIEDDGANVRITGKGSKTRIVRARFQLLMDTRHYIENERELIVNRFKQKYGLAYKEPNEVFLSSKTGKALHPDSISQKLAKVFRKAGVEGSGHRIRARYATNQIEELFRAYYEKNRAMPHDETILLLVAQLMGHSNYRSLRPYLALAKKRLLLNTDTGRLADAKEEHHLLSKSNEIAKAKLSQYKEFESMITAYMKGDKSRFLEEMDDLLKQMEDKY